MRKKVFSTHNPLLADPFPVEEEEDAPAQTEEEKDAPEIEVKTGGH